MNGVRWFVAIVGSITFVIVLFFTSFQFVLYHDINFYEKEYSKYNVLDDVKMSMENVLYVTEEMMDYLIDKRDDLVVETVIDGEEREFFNEREKLHMQDVKKLFMGGVWIRRVAFIIMLLAILMLIKLKADLKNIIPKAFLTATGIVTVILSVAALFISKNFSILFIKFHHIFFDNDYWMLNPETDLMINILPEGFFFDTVKTIGITFGGILGFIMMVSIIVIAKFRKSKV